MNMKESLKATGITVMASWLMMLEDIKGSLTMVLKMALESFNGQMDPFIKASTRMIKNMEKANFLINIINYWGMEFGKTIKY